MMAKLPVKRTPAYVAFMDHFKRYYISCGEPKHKYIIELAPKLNEIYPPRNGDFTIEVMFTASWLSQLLNGKLETFPSPEKFAALILTLQHWAVTIETKEDDPGRASLREWQELLRQAKNNAEQQAVDGVFVDDADSTGEAASAPGGAMRKLRGPQYVLRAEPVHLTPSELSYVMKHGSHAQLRAMEAADGHPQAQFEIGVIFGCDAAHSATALALLKSAAAAGLESALELLDPTHHEFTVQIAAEHARILAHDYQRQGAYQAHHTFRSCATKASVDRNSGHGSPSL